MDLVVFNFVFGFELECSNVGTLCNAFVFRTFGF